jgi:hypothetical protein
LSNIINCHFRRKNLQKKIPKRLSAQVQQARRSIVIRSLTGQRNWSKFTTILRISSEILLFYKVLNATDTVVILGNRDHRQSNATAAVQFTISRFRQTFFLIFVFPLRSNKEILAKILRRYVARHDCLKSDISKERQQSLANPFISKDTQKPHFRQHDQKKNLSHKIYNDQRQSNQPPPKSHKIWCTPNLQTQKKTQPREREREINTQY